MSAFEDLTDEERLAIIKKIDWYLYEIQGCKNNSTEILTAHVMMTDTIGLALQGWAYEKDWDFDTIKIINKEFCGVRQ
tara:strand:+ start:157 stop:390 length:234 start_codon:yes stop_codon:yes gene_type:complete